MMEFGVQTFTIRRQQKKDLRKAYLPLIRMGIRDFEIARIHFDETTGRQVRALMDAHDIRVVAIQVKPKQVFSEVEQVVAFCQQTDCKNVVLSQLPFGCVLGSERKFREFVANLDRQAKIYAEHGITLAYHHHHWEYVPVSGGKTRMDVLLEKTSHVKFVHDTYWTTKCGLSSPQQILRFGQRLVGIHLRDLTLYQRGLDVRSKDAAVGCGVVDFAQVLQSAAQVGNPYLVIEQKTLRPYAHIKRSYRHCLQLREALEGKYDQE